MCSVCATFVGAPHPKCSLLRGRTESPAGNTINDNHDYPEAKHRPSTENLQVHWVYIYACHRTIWRLHIILNTSCCWANDILKYL